MEEAMTRKELVFQAGSDAEIRALAARIHDLRVKFDTASVITPAAPAVISKPELGLTVTEAAAILPCLRELTINAAHGLTGRRQPDADSIDRALASAGVKVTAAIEFDGQTGRGRISVTHPLIPGLSPEFDLAPARQARAAASDVNPDGLALGGIARIETGSLDWELTNAGLTHSVVQSADESVAPDNSGLGKRRKVWLDFQRQGR